MSDDDYEPPIDTIFDRDEEARQNRRLEPPSDSKWYEERAAYYQVSVEELRAFIEVDEDDE